TGTRHTIHLIFSGGGWLSWPSLRASSPVAYWRATGTRHSILLGPEPINPECAVREHKGQPCRPAPRSCVRDARARGISLAAPPLRPSSAEAPSRSLHPHESLKGL